jgi:DNA replication protein DnaC
MSEDAEWENGKAALQAVQDEADARAKPEVEKSAVTAPKRLSVPEEFREMSANVTVAVACPTCGTEDWPGRGCRECSSRAARKAWRLREAKEAFLRSVPKRWQWASFEAPELAARVRDTRATDMAMSLGLEASAVFVGGAASGKTTLAVCVAFRRADSGIKVTFVTSQELARARAAYALGDGEPRVVASAMTAPLLILDDLGPTLVTTALLPDEMAQRYGDGIARRVYELPIVVIQCRGSSK